MRPLLTDTSTGFFKQQYQNQYKHTSRVHEYKNLAEFLEFRVFPKLCRNFVIVKLSFLLNNL
jgi:hypothetical protein